MLQQANDSSESIAYIFYSKKYWRTLKDFPKMTDIVQAEQDAWTIHDMLIDGLGLQPKNVKMIANPTNKDMVDFKK